MTEVCKDVPTRQASSSLGDLGRRAFDVVVSALGLLLLSPLMVSVAIVVRLDSSGPILFRQVRVGREFRDFVMFKFRSMTSDAPSRGPQITAGADCRITRVGYFLRATKIDELPQLFNVLRGDMALVGPRPEVPKYVAMFRDDYREILSVRPGITDLASIEFRNESDVLARAKDPEREYIERVLPRKLLLTRKYIRRSSFRYDLTIIIRTLYQLFR